MNAIIVLTVVALVQALAAGLPDAQPDQGPYPFLESRIAGGQLGTLGQFPYQVHLYLVRDASSSIWCGGSLISEHWVLTAAHCTHQMKTVTVSLGAVNRNAAKQVIVSTEIYTHESYIPATISNDIALIKLPVPAELSEYVQPAVLPRMLGSFSNYLGDTVITSGWGKTSDNTIYISDDLYYIFRRVEPNPYCASIYGENFVTHSHICLAALDGQSTCSGDSGGPLVLNDYKRTQIGVTSFGAQEGCQLGYPTVFTRLTSYLGWIKNISGVYNN